MAKFKQNNVELRDNQRLIFDSAKAKYMSYDGAEVYINTTLSGIDPTENYHLTTKTYVDTAITTATGSLTSDHGDLTGLLDDDHTQYLLRADFTTYSGAIVAQIPTDYYTQAQVDAKWPTWSGTIDHNTIINAHNLTTDIDHDQLTNYSADEHFTVASIDHSAISNLDYASAGHTGFASYAALTSTSGVLSSEIDSDIATHTANANAHHNRAHAITSTSDHTANNWKVWYSNGSGQVTELSLGAANTVLTSAGASSAPTFSTPVFGSQRSYGSSDTQSDTTSATAVQKLRHTTASLPSGTYHIQWGFEFHVTVGKNNGEFNARVQINDTTTIAAVGDSADWGIEDIWVAQSGFYEAALSGVQNIDIDYWDTASIGISMRRARISVWRVA